MLIETQRLRNLTTGRLHTERAHIHDDLGWVLGKLVCDFKLRSAYSAILPWLKEKVVDERYFDGEYDPTHTGCFELPEPTKEERSLMTERFSKNILK